MLITRTGMTLKFGCKGTKKLRAKPKVLRNFVRTQCIFIDKSQKYAIYNLHTDIKNAWTDCTIINLRLWKVPISI